MKISKVLFMTVLAGNFLLAGTTYADKAAMVRMKSTGMTDAQECDMTENVQMYLNFSSQQADPKAAKDYMDERIAKAKEMGAQMGLESIDVQSHNYSVSKYNSGNCNAEDSKYNINGNITLIISPESLAVDYMTALEKEGFNVNLNVNAYKQCR